ncbi:MAG: hypothetical protein Solumvirus1_60 [Solumvirus sp.]|uniref:Uncharacterized protein n=1 Tax=Solumvirus sp. TaxID=2487773 RepID=A0A3G5AG51_9VIRU|nr:MAG: hypothetical protein Solumvirus1_60 [Solumvirus sp.]
MTDIEELIILIDKKDKYLEELSEYILKDIVIYVYEYLTFTIPRKHNGDFCSVVFPGQLSIPVDNLEVVGSTKSTCDPEVMSFFIHNRLIKLLTLITQEKKRIYLSSYRRGHDCEEESIGDYLFIPLNDSTKNGDLLTGTLTISQLEAVDSYDKCVQWMFIGELKDYKIQRVDKLK